MKLPSYCKFLILLFSICLYSVSAQDQKLSPAKEIPASSSIVEVPVLTKSRTEKSSFSFGMKGIKDDQQLENLVKNFDSLKDLENVSIKLTGSKEGTFSFSALRVQLVPVLEAFYKSGFEYFVYEGQTYSIFEYVQSVPKRSPDQKVEEKPAN